MTATPADGTVPWAPEGLPIPAATLAQDWAYVVLEEIVGRQALLRRWSWPFADPDGRLVWPGRSERETGSAVVDVEVLRAQLYLPNVTRRPRCGDTFAVEGVRGGAWRRGRQIRDVRDLFTARVYDVSADAREAVKIAYLCSLVPVRPADAEDEQARALNATTLAQRAAAPLEALVISAPPEGR
jgi:hypothetical protein